jgi:hypothetical protein
MAKISDLTTLLDRLDGADIHYTLSSVREGAIMVVVTVAEERWGIEFMADGDVEVEVFRSDAEIHDSSMIEGLFQRHAEG